MLAKQIGFTMLTLVVGTAVLACQPKSPEVWPPRVTLAALTDEAAPASGYRLLCSTMPPERLPGQLAVLKYVVSAEGKLSLAPLALREQAFWVDVIRGIPTIAGVVFPEAPVYPDRPSLVQGARTAAKAVHADIVVVYVPNQYGANTAQVIGAVIDVATGDTLATLRAEQSFVTVKGEETPPAAEAGDLRDTDAAYQAARAFEGYLRVCLASLANEAELATGEPAPWNAAPDHRWWVPLFLWEL